MKVLVSKSNIHGTVAAPPSKSYTLRGVICAALAKGESRILNPLGSDDTEAAVSVLGKVGIKVVQDEDAWYVGRGVFKAPTESLFCNESAVTLRFMTAISALIPGECHLTAAPSLARRPIEPLISAMQQLGIDCRQDTDKTITVHGGSLRGGLAELPGNISSQFVSAMLLIAPFAKEGMTIRLTTPLESQPYVLMTMECLEKFGVKVKVSPDFREYNIKKQSYKPTEYNVEGDWSSASYLLALGALAGEIRVTNLNPDSLQGDKAIADYLKQMGANIIIKKDLITVRKSVLKALKADLTDCTDLLPTVAVLAAAAEGTSQLTGIARARLKESDRPSALTEGLTKMGIKVIEEENRLVIIGNPVRDADLRRGGSKTRPHPEAIIYTHGDDRGTMNFLTGASDMGSHLRFRSGRVSIPNINTRGDHRIAMAFSLLGTIADGTTIDNAECVAKTYPEYWETLKRIGGKVLINGK